MHILNGSMNFLLHIWTMSFPKLCISSMSFPKLFISSFVCYSDLFTTLCLLTARGHRRGPCATSLSIVLFICLGVFVSFWPYYDLCHWCVFKSMNYRHWMLSSEYNQSLENPHGDTLSAARLTRRDYTGSGCVAASYVDNTAMYYYNAAELNCGVLAERP